MQNTEISNYFSSFAISFAIYIREKNRRTQRETYPYYDHLAGLDVRRQL